MSAFKILFLVKDIRNSIGSRSFQAPLQLVNGPSFSFIMILLLTLYIHINRGPLQSACMKKCRVPASVELGLVVKNIEDARVYSYYEKGLNQKETIQKIHWHQSLTNSTTIYSISFSSISLH